MGLHLLEGEDLTGAYVEEREDIFASGFLAFVVHLLCAEGERCFGKAVPTSRCLMNVPRVTQGIDRVGDGAGAVLEAL